MATNFYKQNGSYYRADNSQKILNLNELKTFAQNGGKEVSVPSTKTSSVAIPTPSDIPNYTVTGKSADGKTLLGIPKITPPSNKMDGSTIKIGVENGNLTSQLPDTSPTQTAIDIYTNNALTGGQTSLDQLNKELATLQAQNLKQIESDKTKTESELAALQVKRQNELDTFKSQTDPINTGILETTQRMVDSTKQIPFDSLVKQRLELTTDVVNYSKLMREQLDISNAQPASISVSQGRSTAIQQNYLSKISTSQAALQAIDGNFDLASTIMDNAANHINDITTNNINFLNFVEQLYGGDITDKKNKLLTLTADEKTAISELKTKLETDIKNVEANKTVIQNLMASPTTAMIAKKAGLLLTDTQDVVAEKLNKYYIQNPSLVPETVASLQAKYPDAGINFWDTNEVITKKIQSSAVFQKENAGSGNTLAPKDLLEQAQKLVESGDATNITDAINQIQNAFSGISADPNDRNLNRPQRNNNPGNIKAGGVADKFAAKDSNGKPMVDDQRHLIFENAGAGFAALISDLTAKLNGGSRYVKADPTLAELGKVYAEDGSWASKVANLLGVTVNTKAKSVDFNQLVKAIATQEGFYANGYGKDVVPTSTNQTVDSWVKRIESGQNKVTEITNEGLRNKVIQELAKNGKVSQADAQTTTALNEKIKLIDDTIKLVPLANAVGPNAIARMSIGNILSGKKQELIGNVEQLVSQNTLDALLNLKKAGGTLGALSEGEKDMLRNAATKIGSWAKKKNGQVVAYDISESVFIKELNNLKQLAQTALKNAGGSTGIVNSIEQFLANSPDRVDEYNTIIQSNPNLSEDEILQVLGQ